MKEMTSSCLAYYPTSNQSENTIFHSWSTSRDRATWMSSMGLGLGLGITAGSGLNVYHTRGGRLYLALILGQLAVPAASGYLTERVLHKNASETLGRTTVVLSFLMFLSLFIDLFLQVVRRFSWWRTVISWFSCFPEPKKKKIRQTEIKEKPVDVSEIALPKECPAEEVWRPPTSLSALELEPIRVSTPEP